MSPIARDELQRREWTFADKSDLAVGLTTLAAVIFGAGFWTSQWVESRKPAPPPVVKVVTVKPLTQWSCRAQEFREYRHACAARKRSDITQNVNPITKGRL